MQAVLHEWTKIQEIVNILQIPYIITKRIQDPDFALSDFYGCWLKMYINIKKLINTGCDQMGLAQALISSLEKRKGQLLKHPAMFCAVFLDPRFYFDLTEDEKNFARLNIKNIWNRVIQFKSKISDCAHNDDDVDSLELYLAEKCGPIGENKTVSNEPNFQMSSSCFMKSIEQYEANLSRLHHSISILDFWSNRIDASKHIANSVELQYVASTVLSIPSTQVPCERSFSGLNFVFSSKRASIDPKLLEAILLIRENRDLYDIIKLNDLALSAPFED